MPLGSLIMSNIQPEPLRDAPMSMDDNGKPSWRGMCSHKNIKVRSACYHPVQLPGLIIFVHGVNSEGEWYDSAEANLCNGLNGRLNLPPYMKLKENIYQTGKTQLREIANPDASRSPVIRFYWGYSAEPGTEDNYQIPLRNLAGDDYHDLKKYQKLPDAQIAARGPWYWGGGPFQNGCNQLVSLWSDQGFSKWLKQTPIPFSVQFVNSELDRLLANAPARHYYAHAARRLADLLDTIRNTYPKDTVTLISHSQGTMIAMAATLLADKAPDALFVMNSPYAMEHKAMDRFSYPFAECISTKARHKTFGSIVEKVAKQAGHLSEVDYSRLVVGVDADGKSWKPTGMVNNEIPERDNHGRTWIYCNAHDRVMGMSALLSIGWQGLPNDVVGRPNQLLITYQGHLFQRMMARETPCGGIPRRDAPFGRLPPAGSPFWDDGGQFGVYDAPPPEQKLYINGEKVPEPITAKEMVGFDATRVGLQKENEKNTGEEGYGWGQYSVDSNGNKTWHDDTFRWYASLYPEQWVTDKGTMSWYPQNSKDERQNRRRETRAEKDTRLRMFVSQPSDHSSLPSNPLFMRRVVAYDLPVGICESSNDKSFLEQLRRMADWQYSDAYFRTGRHPQYSRPAEVDAESAGGISPEEMAEMRKMEARQGGH